MSVAGGTTAITKKRKCCPPVTWVLLPVQACKYCAKVFKQGTTRCDCITKHKCMAVQFNGEFEEGKILK